MRFYVSDQYDKLTLLKPIYFNFFLELYDILFQWKQYIYDIDIAQTIYFNLFSEIYDILHQWKL